MNLETLFLVNCLFLGVVVSRITYYWNFSFMQSLLLKLSALFLVMYLAEILFLK